MGKEGREQASSTSNCHCSAPEDEQEYPFFASIASIGHSGEPTHHLSSPPTRSQPQPYHFWTTHTKSASAPRTVCGSGEYRGGLRRGRFNVPGKTTVAWDTLMDLEKLPWLLLTVVLVSEVQRRWVRNLRFTGQACSTRRTPQSPLQVWEASVPFYKQ